VSFRVTDQHIEQYATDGVVCLKQAISPAWIETLKAGLARNLVEPSPRARQWNQAADGTTTNYDSQSWQSNPEYRDFILNSNMAEVAGQVMNCQAVNFYFDAIFVRSAGAQFRTPFHQDEPYWSVEGFDCSSAWMPLVPVAKQSALEFVRGSHRWNQKYAQTNFGAMTGDARDQVAFGTDLPPFPDVEGEREKFDLVSWDMEPGDVALFNARTIHGGSGLLAPDRGLPVFNTQWLGDDVRVCFRPEGMDPDHSQVMTEIGLVPGDRIGGALYPEVWRRADPALAG
jgi:ectoine hydroxylase-related dioxygenase (phytanoyl-CoA dioxygenase family)